MDVYVVVTYGVKISEVARNIQENIKYNLAKQLNIQAEEINVYIQDVRLMID
ncbi:General stress protein, Gls24 family [Brochothrix thermosphacta DSM 20171 = FSL F6-1036]|nr:General stress protein, Gls24 family [Brochothrix thermosphacta DSM 20171 = FSL F6-1036]